MRPQHITKNADFHKVCQDIKAAGKVAFDTEFVSEFYYRPRLCLLQFAVAEQMYTVDPFEVDDLAPWWEIMADEETLIIAHGSREEVRFCHRFTGGPPRKMVDVQIAEGILSRGFPVAYKNLVGRVLGKKVSGKETRSDWERRPLSPEQLEYASEDVLHLHEVWARQQHKLQSLNRFSWFNDEMERFLGEVAKEGEREGWRRLPGAQGMHGRDQALARALHQWRDKKAEELDKPPRTVFRDDMLIEVLRRHPTTVQELNMTRGMQRRDYQRFADELVAIVNHCLTLSPNEWPKSARSVAYPSSDEALTRLLTLALANRCGEMNVSMSLVGTTHDIEDLVHWHIFDERNGPAPRLLQGWRAEVCGDLLTDLLDGKIAIRVYDPKSETPLRFEGPV